jgi:DNA polymerase-3 subunit gamma/tau
VTAKVAQSDPSEKPASPKAPDTPETTAATQTAKTANATQANTAPALGNSEESHHLHFKQLIDKIYDRDYDLGTIFENNIAFKDFQNGKLTWYSTAEGEEKKQLIHNWQLIKMFVQEVFGIGTRIINVPSDTKKKTPESRQQHNHHTTPFEESGSTIASLTEPPEMSTSEASVETDPSTLLEEPMIQALIKRFAAKKVRIIRKS